MKTANSTIVLTPVGKGDHSLSERKHLQYSPSNSAQKTAHATHHSMHSIIQYNHYKLYPALEPIDNQATLYKT